MLSWGSRCSCSFISQRGDDKKRAGMPVKSQEHFPTSITPCGMLKYNGADKSNIPLIDLSPSHSHFKMCNYFSGKREREKKRGNSTCIWDKRKSIHVILSFLEGKWADGCSNPVTSFVLFHCNTWRCHWHFGMEWEGRPIHFHVERQNSFGLSKWCNTNIAVTQLNPNSTSLMAIQVKNSISRATLICTSVNNTFTQKKIHSKEKNVGK